MSDGTSDGVTLGSREGGLIIVGLFDGFLLGDFVGYKNGATEGFPVG